MDEFTAQIQRNGQITLPANIRKTEGLEVGDFVKMAFIEKKEAKKPWKLSTKPIKK